MNIYIIDPYLHFNTLTASGNVVLARELLRAINRVANIKAISAITSKGERYPGFIKGSIVCYKGLREKVLKNAEIVHLIDIPIVFLPYFYKRTKKYRGKIIYHLWSLPNRFIELLTWVSILKRFTDIVVCTSIRLAKILMNYNFPKSKLRIVPPPIDTSIYRPISRKRDNEVHTILYIGSLHPRRFPAFEVIKAVKMLHEHGYKIALRIIGAPRYSFDYIVLSKLRNISIKLGISERLDIIYKQVPMRDKIRMYNNADMVIFPYTPSVRDIIDPPITLLESMSCARTIAATPVLSIPSIIEDGHNGFLCKSHEGIHLYHCIERALLVNDRKHLVGKNARETIQEHFSLEKVSETLKQIYYEL